MTQTRRLILNVAASNGRSLFVIVCGFLTGRWALMALGVEDYGLLGLVGGLAILFTVFNTVFSTSVSRFYAYAIGETSAKGGEGTGDCRRWFNVAFLVHVALAVGLVLVGYPVGVWLIRHFLTIPANRVEDCVWVLRWVFASAFIGIASVPFRAMYTARQYIAELTVYSLFQTTAYTLVLFYMVNHPRDWLVWMAAWLAFQNSFVNLVITIRSFALFPECRLRVAEMFDRGRLRRLAGFSGWQFLGSLGMAVRDQGMGILVNKCFGAARNASYTVSWTLSGRSQTFANEIDAAFSPAITTAYGAGDRELVASLVCRCSKFSSCLVLLFVIPLVIEMDAVLNFWLKTPPPFTAPLCSLICVSLAINKLASGQALSILASGNIRAAQTATFLCLLGTIPVALVGYWLGFGVPVVGFAFLLLSVFQVICNVLIARRVVGMPVLVWLRGVLLPLLIAAGASAGVSFLPRFFLAPSLWRLLLTGLVFAGTFSLCTWRLVLTGGERMFVVAKSRRFKEKFAAQQTT